MVRYQTSNYWFSLFFVLSVIVSWLSVTCMIIRSTCIMIWLWSIDSWQQINNGNETDGWQVGLTRVEWGLRCHFSNHSSDIALHASQSFMSPIGDCPIVGVVWSTCYSVGGRTFDHYTTWGLFSTSIKINIPHPRLSTFQRADHAEPT